MLKMALAILKMNNLKFRKVKWLDGNSTTTK